MTHINPQIFREYDIRGTVGVDINKEVAYLLGRAYGTLAKEHNKNSIGVGYDCRLSSEKFAHELARGLNESGIDVVTTGMGPTPQLYYAIRALELGGGIQVTGSHNPPDMNGFKLCLGTHTLAGEEIQDLLRRIRSLPTLGNIEQSAPVVTVEPSGGTTKSVPIQEQYIKMLVENSRSHMGLKKLKVVCDAGNGVGGMIGPAVLRQLGVEVIELFCDPDGRFPNHHPDPTEIASLESLIAKVRETGADFGIGWDGDADRIGVVDENGEVIFGDILLTIFARSILKLVPGATIIGDVKCSSRLFDDVRAKGGTPIMWRTGHSLIKSKLYETNAALAGEMSGHIFFNHRFYGFDDALYASCRLVEIASQAAGPLSSLASDLPVAFATPEIRVACPEEIKFAVPAKVKEAFSELPVDTIDGVRLSFPNGWGLVRASNTQPVLVLRFEAASEKDLADYQETVVNKVERIKQQLL